MRVRISYGVDVDRVPEKTQDLLYNSTEQLRETVRMLERIIEDLDQCEENSSNILKIIDKSRKNLSEADLTISDAQSILTALNSYYKGEHNVSEGRPTMDPSGDTITSTSDPG